MKTLLLIFTLFLSLSSFAKESGMLQVQPIVGFERVQKFSPTPHTKNRTIFGARVIFGPPLLSLEVEGTRADDSETFYDQDLKVDEEAYAAKVGLRSGVGFAGLLRIFVRAGGHARKSKITKTQAGLTTEEEPAIRVSPYAGAGLSFKLLNNLTANAGYTVIFTGKPKGSDREYQTTLGVGARF